MIKKTIKYVDFDGNQREEEFLFHLSGPELTRFRAKLGGDDPQEVIKAIVQKGSMEEVLKLFEDMILSAYGEKSIDGRKFIKTDEIRQNFEYSQAYAELFEELLTSPESMQEFASKLFVQTVAKDRQNPVNNKFQPNTN